MVGVWNALFALATLGILWNARCRAVYFWSLSGLGGAGFAFFTASPWQPVLYTTWWGEWVIGLTVIGSAWIKATAIRILAQPERSLRTFYLIGVALLVGITVGPLLPIERLWFSLCVVLSVSLLMIVVAREAFRIGQTRKLWNAKILAAIVGVQAVVVIVSTLASAVIARDPLMLTAEPVAMSSVVLNFSAGLASTALFISLVLDINLLQREEIRERLSRAELDRSRRDERLHVLADMHDGLGSELTTARLKLERGALPQQELLELVNECIADMHLMVDTLRESAETLSQALADYRLRIERRLAGSHIRLVWRTKLSGAPAMAPKPLLQVLRIIQEAISNALKHADATEIVVSALYVPGSGYEIKVEDDGIGMGIGADVGAGRGLGSLRRRAAEIGAALTVERRGPGGGTRVALRLA